MSNPFRTCAAEGCGARVLVRGKHLHCERHRPKSKGGHKRQTEESRKRALEREKRQRMLAGLPDSWVCP
jgi:hypothetical protein